MGKQSWTTVQQTVSKQKKNGKEVLLEVHRCVGYAGHGVDDFEERVKEFDTHGYPYIIYAHPNPADLNAVQEWEHKHQETLARLKSEGKYAHIAERRQQPDWIEAYKKYLQFLQSSEGENAKFLIKSVAKNFVLRILKKEESAENGKELQQATENGKELQQTSKNKELQGQIEKLAQLAFAQMTPDLNNKNESSENPVLHALEETVDCISALVPDKDHPAYLEDKTKVFKIVVSLDGFGGSVDHAFKFAQKLNYVLDSAVPINLAPSLNAQLINGSESRKDKKHEQNPRKKKEVAKKESTTPQDQVSSKEQNLDGSYTQTAITEGQQDNSTNKKVHTMLRQVTQQETTANDDTQDLKNEKDLKKDSSKTSDKDTQLSSEQPSQQVTIPSSNLPQVVNSSDKKELRNEQPSQQYFTTTQAFLISSMDFAVLEERIAVLEDRIIDTVCKRSLEEANGIVKGKENSADTLKELQQLSEVNGIVLGGILQGFRSRFAKGGTSSIGMFGAGPKANIPPANMPTMTDMSQEHSSTPKTTHMTPRQNKVYG